jgi:hypothetical protein
MTLTGTIEHASRLPSSITGSRSSSPERPSLRSVVSRLAVNLWIACVIPAVLFYLTLVTFNISAAVVVALGWSYGAIGWRWATKRRRSGLLALTVSVMTVRTVIVLSTGNTFVYFFQPVVTDVAVGTVFLLSLATARPIVARLAADFYPMDLDLAVRPRVRQLFWRLTLLWALFCLFKGALSFWLLESQSTVNFVLIKNLSVITMTVLVVAATVQASVLVARKEGLLVTA